MIAMILAAGRGERLRPLTDKYPKPLLKAGGKALIVHTIERLKAAGIRDIIINTAWLGQQLEDKLGDGRQWGVSIRYSHEQTQFGCSLETAGGIRAMLPMTNHQPFLALNGDIVCDFDLKETFHIARRLNPSDNLAHLILVPNPDHHPNGDFIYDDGRIMPSTDTTSVQAPRLTFSGIGIYHPDLFAPLPLGHRIRLADILTPAITQGKVTAQCHNGVWIDAGTPERLQRADYYYGAYSS